MIWIIVILGVLVGLESIAIWLLISFLKDLKLQFDEEMNSRLKEKEDQYEQLLRVYNKDKYGD